MKQILFYLFLAAAIASCSKGKVGDKHAELEQLKKQQAGLRDQIIKLEAEIAATDTTHADNKSKIVSVTEIKPREFNHYIEVQARVEGDQDVTVSAQSMGNITAVIAEAGDAVHKGQVLATIDDKALRQGYAEVQSQLDLAVQLFNRQKNLWDQQIGSEVQFLQAKTNKEAIEKRLATIQEQLDMTRIKSPIDGTVDEVRIKIGESVAPGVPAFRVVNLNALKVKGEVAESYIDKVKRGNRAIIYFPDIGKEVQAKLDYSGKVINRLNRTFNVEIKLDSKDVELHPNMIAVLKIGDYNQPAAFVLPIGAVQKSGAGEFVYVTSRENGKLFVKRKTVTSGVIYNGETEIKSGLSAGDQVITTGYQNIIEGDPIQL